MHSPGPSPYPPRWPMLMGIVACNALIGCAMGYGWFQLTRWLSPKSFITLSALLGTLLTVLLCFAWDSRKRWKRAVETSQESQRMLEELRPDMDRTLAIMSQLKAERAEIRRMIQRGGVN